MKPLASLVYLGARLLWLVRHRKLTPDRTAFDVPHLFVDVSAIVRHDAQTGVQRVVRAIWTELNQRDDKGYRLVPVYASHTHGYSYAPLNFLDFPKLPPSPQAVMASAGDRFLGLDLSAHFLPKYRSQVRAWRDHGATIHVVVYDLLPILRPEWFNEATVSHFRKWFNVLASDADQAICISNQVARNLRDELQARKRPSQLAITNMGMGGDIAASRPSSGICDEVKRLLRHLEARPAILMVGTIEPRKGYDAALAAFEHLWRSAGARAPDLVIVGKGGWKTRALQERIKAHPERNKRLHWLDKVSDEGLCKLYDSCLGVFMASRGEGFGLPLVEAASHRKHVLARDLPVFREQALPNVLYFDDEDPAVLGERLMELARLGLSHGPETPDMPTWSASVDALLDSLGLASPAAATLAPPLRDAG